MYPPDNLANSLTQPTYNIMILNDKKRLRVDLDLGPCGEQLQQYPDGHFDVLITDPPYGLGDQPDVDELLEKWAEDEDYNMGSGFMGKKWDTLPPPASFKEVRRVLKPGARGAVFAGTRTWDLMMISLKLAGFEVEDLWRYSFGTGFPKSFKVKKHILKKVEDRYGSKEVRCECEEEAEWNPEGEPDEERENDREIIPDNYEDHDLTTRVCSWCLKPDDRFLRDLEGKGTALKAAYEPILIVRKPETPRDDRDELLKRYGVEK